MDGRTDGRTEGWMDGWMDFIGCIDLCMCTPLQDAVFWQSTFRLRAPFGRRICRFSPEKPASFEVVRTKTIR